jgi:glycosyltransferase involved in cell wall biosynthesis
MKIAFYAPLKPPDHPVPSGDRQMARHLIAALTSKGNDVSIPTRLRCYLKEPAGAAFEECIARSQIEIARVAAEWSKMGPADLWFTYHPYYRAPDLVGPEIARRFAIPYVTCEASYAAKRDRDEWRDQQAKLKDAVRQAVLNLCFTARDRQGLAAIAPASTLATIAPFIATGAAPSTGFTENLPGNLITVAMMRGGVKFESFQMLASALALLSDLPWHLTVVGDGPLADQVRNLFRQFPEERLTWTGEVPPDDVARHLREASIYVWPGFGEAYGLAYLEAQALRLPVIAQSVAGVPEVVIDGRTGLLVGEGDVGGFAAAIRRWIANPAERTEFGKRARDFVLKERSLSNAADALDALLSRVVAVEGWARG